MEKTPHMDHVKPHLCFVAHWAYGAVTGGGGHIGGIETQTALMARSCAARGYPVSVITWDEGQDDGREIDGVRMFKMCRPSAGLPGLRFCWPRWSSLNAAMRRADADIYYYNCGDLGLGQVVMWCRRNARKSVYSVANDPDCDPRLPKLTPLRERVLFQHGLRHVDAIIVQTQRQQQMLRDGFAIESTVIQMPCAGFHNGAYAPPEAPVPKPTRVLWVGRISREKRLEWLLDIAEKCPEIVFEVVGAANTDCEYASRVANRASGIANVKMHGRIPHCEMGKYYRRSHILCCTSAYEGFPNTFVEAWSCAIPVVATVDPDNVIAKYNVGWTASSVNECVECLKSVRGSCERWRAASYAAWSYYAANHTIAATMGKFERMFLDIMGHRVP